ncbi:signal peptide, CUB and EGF-like domain-containing protein 3 [Montipora capricornis]|uniref:signal peptide, CUB and EGF-like domain-containing protein 3 n=1 Tax=Montipora capricornis TaxID=246305 RepID=UPI0035F17E4F
MYIIFPEIAADLLWNFGLLGINAANSKTNITCQPCPKGTLGNNSKSHCQDCSKGWCEGTQYCIKCPAGQYQNITGQTKCIPCPKGYYQKDSGHDVCQPCRKGEHQDKAGQTKCELCPKGFTSGALGSERCMSCPFGGYCNKLGCTKCAPCPPGTEADRMGAQNCTLCNPGYFKESLSYDICQLCKRGWYQVKKGQRLCNECPQGSYCPWQDSLPMKCDPNQKCPKGSFSAGSECSLFYKRGDKAETCNLSSTVYILIAAAITVTLVVAGIVYLRRQRRKNECQQRILERQYPVYTGW